MTGETFKLTVEATNPEEAFEKASQQVPGRTSFSFVKDTPADVIDALTGKLRRARENPKLYADKIEEYEEQLLTIGLDKRPAPLVVADAMLAHGDSRLDNRTRLCIIRVNSKQYLIFGVK